MQPNEQAKEHANTLARAMIPRHLNRRDFIRAADPITIRELPNPVFTPGPWSFEASALRAPRPMPNPRATGSKVPRVRPRGPRGRARNDPREARLRTPAPVYLGHSSATRAVQVQIQRALGARGPVLVSGAPGTGKRTVAEILHHFSAVEGPLEQVRIVKGRFGPVGEFAYLGPVEELSLAQQARLLEHLEPVDGGRIVLGTRLALDGDEARERLHRRLLRACSIRIELPTLRRRIDDLEALSLRILCELPSRRPIGGIDDDALDCLRAHPWRGNVTELEQVLRAAVEVGTTPQIELRDLPPELRLRAVESLDQGLPDIEFSLAHAERSAIERAMRYARSNKRKAARLLRISKTTLYRKLRQYHVPNDWDELDGLEGEDGGDT
ncbi:MAG: helix-turn-helix domain-containing protein [Enhygromyxa sp.]